MVEIPDAETGGTKKVKLSEMGIKIPVMLPEMPIDWKHEVPEIDPQSAAALQAPAVSPIRNEGQPTGPTASDGPKMINLPKFEFVVQFIWREPKRTADAENWRTPTLPPWMPPHRPTPRPRRRLLLRSVATPADATTETEPTPDATTGCTG